MPTRRVDDQREPWSDRLAGTQSSRRQQIRQFCAVVSGHRPARLTRRRGASDGEGLELDRQNGSNKSRCDVESGRREDCRDRDHAGRDLEPIDS